VDLVVSRAVIAEQRLAGSSAGIAAGCADVSHLLGFVVGRVAGLPRVLGCSGVVSHCGSSVLEQHLFDQVQLLHVFYYVRLLFSRDDLSITNSLRAWLIVFRLATVVHHDN